MRGLDPRRRKFGVGAGCVWLHFCLIYRGSRSGSKGQKRPLKKTSARQLRLLAVNKDRMGLMATWCELCFRKTALRADLPGAQAQLHAAACDQLARRANQFGFSEIVSSPGIK